jgi:outer membrane protein assembly factor BamB
VRDWVHDHLRGDAYRRLETSAGPRASLPWLREWNVPLLPGEVLLPGSGERTGPAAAALFTGVGTRTASSPDKGQLRRRSAETGVLQWQSRLPFVPTWSGCHADLVLTGGAEGIAGLRQEDGEQIWFFPAPAYDPFPTAATAPLRPLSTTHPAEPLASFRLEGGRLFCVQGQRRLFALDAETGKVVWHAWAPGAAFRLPDAEGCFLPPFQVRADVLSIATGLGRTHLLDAATGRLLQEVETPVTGPFSTLLAEGRGVCLATDEGHLQRLEPVSGKVLWKCAAPWTTILTGQAPRLFGSAKTLLVAWSTNLGLQVQQLDWETGQPRWSVLLPADAALPETAPFFLDDAAFYFFRGDTLHARSLVQGKLLWSKPLVGPAGGWHLGCCQDSLIAWTMAPKTQRFQFRWLGGSLQWDVGLSGARGAGWRPVVCLDPQTGALVERLNFAAADRVTPPQVRFRGSLAVLPRLEFASTTDDRGQYLRMTRTGAVVVAGREIWGLAAAKK